MHPDQWLIRSKSENFGLGKIFRLSAKNDLGWAEMVPNTTFFSTLGTDGGARGTILGQFGIPTVQFVRARAEGFHIPVERLPALIVNIDAPDGVIMKEIKRTLTEARKQVGTPVTSP